MLEQNSFRLYMVIGGIITVALLLAMFFSYPMVELDDDGRDAYGRVMDVSESEMADKESLTMYETVMFTIQAKPRSDVREY